MNILQSLTDHYDRLLKREELNVPPYPYSLEKISFCVLLSGKGRIENIQVQDLRQMSANGPRPSQHIVPQSPIRSREIRPAFLWDKTAYVFGAKRKKNTAQIQIAADEHNAFKEFHRHILASTSDEGLQAFLGFLDNWEPDNYSSFCRHAQDMLDTNVVFQLVSDEMQYLHDRPAAKKLWELVADQEEQDMDKGRCLITGKVAPIARRHRPVKGVKGANSSGARIVSFNQDSFTSYRKKQGDNAPISNRAAHAYTTALSLLASDAQHSVQVGDTTTVFWAEVPNVEPMIRGFLEPPPPGDDVVVAKIRSKLEQIAQGFRLVDIDPELDLGTRYFILGLAPNKARLSVRFWQQGSFGEFYDRFCEHWRDLRIYPSFDNQKLLSVHTIVNETAKLDRNASGQHKRKYDRISPLLAGETIRAVITGQPYPRSLFSAIIMRIRADRVVNMQRAAILKACLVRNSRIKHEFLPEDYLMSLNRDNTDPAYRLGRLFALLERVQWEAMDKKVNATIRDRYYATASATPARTFPAIMRIAMFLLAKLRKEKAGLANSFEKEIEQVFNDLDSAFPQSFDLDDQGRFVIGYYHQRFTSKQRATREDASCGANDNKE